MIDEAHFKLAMSHFASGVTIVTTEHDGRDFGMTVASFASLSLRPPLVLICIERAVRSHDAIAAAGHFAVNILAESQTDISNRFASRIEDKFDGVAVRRGLWNLPLIDGALTSVECEIRQTSDGGDHTIFVGEVLAISTTEGAPLIYYRSGYRTLGS